MYIKSNHPEQKRSKHHQKIGLSQNTVVSEKNGVNPSRDNRDAFEETVTTQKGSHMPPLVNSFP